MAAIKRLWARYLTWRNTPTNAREPLPETAVSKVDASDGDIISHATSNLSGGHGGST